MGLKLLHEPENDDLILSVVNIIDFFLVIIAALMITVAQKSLLNAFFRQDVTVITDPGKPIMEMMVKKGEKIERYKSSPAARSVRRRCQGRRRPPHEGRFHGLCPGGRRVSAGTDAVLPAPTLAACSSASNRGAGRL